MSTADENDRIMSDLEGLEAIMKSPRFWDTFRASAVCQEHALLLQVAIQRGLTTFDRS